MTTDQQCSGDIRYITPVMSRQVTHSLDTIGILVRKFWIVRGLRISVPKWQISSWTRGSHLDGFVDNAVYNPQGVELEVDALHGSLRDLVILLPEMVEELHC